MGIILFILFGIAVGITTSIAINAGRRMFGDVTLAVIGAVMGGLLVDYYAQSALGSVDLYSFFVALLGAASLVVFVRVAAR